MCLGSPISPVISTNDFAYLPGLPPHDPRRLWGKPDSNRQPNVHDVALTSEGLPSYSYFPECSYFAFIALNLFLYGF